MNACARGSPEKKRIAREAAYRKRGSLSTLSPGPILLEQVTQADFKKAAEYFSQAVQKDPGYALSYAGLADSYSLLGDAGYLPPAEAWPKAKTAAMQALNLDDSLGEAHTSLGL